MTHVRFTHLDSIARRDLTLLLEAETVPGQPAVSRLDPGRCEPELGAVVLDVVFRVVRVVLFDGPSCSHALHALDTRDGTLPELAAEALAREFEARYALEEDLQREVDEFILASVYGDNSPED